MAKLTRRQFAQMGAMSGASLALRGLPAQMKMPSGQAMPPPARPIPANAPPADFTLDIAPYVLEPSPKHRYPMLAYNGQVPGPLLRMKQGREVSIDIRNHGPEPDIVHWHGLFLPPATDGAMEEGSPMIAPGASTRITFTPEPAGFRWFHTHTFAGNDLRKAQYGGEHGFLLIEPSESPARGTSAPDREVFLALHDFGGRMEPSADGSAMPMYDVSTINGKMLGFGEPVQVKQGERVMMHVLNSSPTEVHWIALAGHSFQVVALDGNTAPKPETVPMLRLAPAERVSAIVEMNTPGVWVLGEVQKHVQAAGMGMVVEYANATGAPKWIQPEALVWDYAQFAFPPETNSASDDPAEGIPLIIDSKYKGHGNEEEWTINGKSYPETSAPPLKAGTRYSLVMNNKSNNDHPIHLHRHTFEVVNVGGQNMRGLMKDVLLIPAQKTSVVEFVADHPGNTLFHCHQQDHMDRGFMMVFRYA